MDAIRRIADTDEFTGDWDALKAAIKDTIEKNISLFLTTTEKPISPAPYLPVNIPNGGLRLPPFLPRMPNRSVPSDMLVAYMTEQEANDLKKHIFAQLDQFDANPPFTIQRLCELCIEPKKHYNSVGKYLRAVEKSILVTSTWDSYPPLTEAEQRNSSGRSAITLGSTLQSAPSTPLFSPIPFLHEDARRSKSRSPPPTPLALNPVALGLDIPEPKALGLVDELDAPGPGHLSDHPTSLSAAESFDMFDFKAEDAMDTSEAFPLVMPQDTAMDLDSNTTATIADATSTASTTTTTVAEGTGNNSSENA